jgi:membrane-associated phospholipid phosphatase
MGTENDNRTFMASARHAEDEWHRRVRLTAAVYLAWILGYELVGSYASKLHGVRLALPLDARIPLQPGWVWVYMATYLLPLAAALAIADAHRFNRALLAIGLASLSAYVVFVLLPVDFQRPPLAHGTITERLLARQYHYDFPHGGNQLPSLHVANACIVYAAVRGQRLGAWGDRALLVLVLAITASTLLVKQHLVVDVVAGLFWGIASWKLVGRYYSRTVDPGMSAALALPHVLRSLGPLLRLPFSTRRWIAGQSRTSADRPGC